MSRRISHPVRVETDDAGEPRAFTWRGVRYRVEVIGRWHLRDRWWAPWETQSDRCYYRLLTAALTIHRLSSYFWTER